MKKFKNVRLTHDKLTNLLTNSCYQNSIQDLDNIDVDINHLEKIFTDKTYYLAMKIVPLLERKVLYLNYIENLRLNDICKRLKLPRKQIISLRNKAIIHFKYNVRTLTKANTIKGGGKNA